MGSDRARNLSSIITVTRPPTNIAFLLDSNPVTWTSQEDRHLALCRTFLARGCRPVLVFSKELPARLSGPFVEAGIAVEFIDFGKGSYHYYRRLRQLIRKYSIDAVHILFFDYFSPIPWLARLAGIRTIIYEMQNSGVPRATSWRLTVLRWRNKLMMMPMTRVIAISEFVKQQLVYVGVDERKIVVRHLGVNTQRFVPDNKARQEWMAKLGIGPEELILSTVSYLRPFKHPHVIVEACRVLAERDIPFRLIVAGGGEMLPGLKELSASLGIADRIHWLGNWPDPKSLLQASDVFILASVGEAFGLVLAEAMACGVPIVGSRSGAIPELVEHGYTGLLATPLDPLSFADSVEVLARDPHLRKAMGTQGIKQARQNFSVERLVEETARFYGLGRVENVRRALTLQ